MDLNLGASRTIQAAIFDPIASDECRETSRKRVFDGHSLTESISVKVIGDRWKVSIAK